MSTTKGQTREVFVVYDDDDECLWVGSRPECDRFVARRTEDAARITRGQTDADGNVTDETTVWRRGDEDSWSWQRRIQTQPELAATLTLTREELELVRRAFISRADVHPCDWPKARETARSVEAKLYDALRKAGLA